MPEAAFPGYLIGGLAWFSIPFCLATTAGLAALALETTYPDSPLTRTESQGRRIGRFGAAVRGSGSARQGRLGRRAAPHVHELHIGHLSADGRRIHRRFVRHLQDLLQARHFGRRFAAIKPICCRRIRPLRSGFWQFAPRNRSRFGAHLQPDWHIHRCWAFSAHLYLLRHPTASCGGFPGIWINFVAGVAVWLSVAWHNYGVVNLASVGGVVPCLAGCGTGIGVGLVLSVISVLFFPRDFAWSRIPEILEEQHRHAQQLRGEKVAERTQVDEKAASSASSQGETTLELIEHDPSYDPKRLDRSFRIAVVSALTIFVVITIIWRFRCTATTFSRAPSSKAGSQCRSSGPSLPLSA